MKIVVQTITILLHFAPFDNLHRGVTLVALVVTLVAQSPGLPTGVPVRPTTLVALVALVAECDDFEGLFSLQ